MVISKVGVHLSSSGVEGYWGLRKWVQWSLSIGDAKCGWLRGTGEMCEASGVCISSLPCRCGAAVPGVLACMHAYITHIKRMHVRACVLRTPAWMHAILPAKNVHAPVHTCPCNAADLFLPWKLLRTYLESCTSIVHCCLPPALLLSRLNQSLDAVCSKKASKSTLAHYAVAAAVSHKHHSIICVGADLIQFVHV